MAQFIFASIYNYNTTGTVPLLETFLLCLDKFFVDEVIGWLIYSLGFTCMLCLKLLSLLVQWWLPIIAHFWIGYDPGSYNPHAWMLDKPPPNEIPILAWTDVYYAYQNPVLYKFDVRYMILSGYCLYPWFNFLSTGSTAAFYTSYIRALNLGYEQLHKPTTWLLTYVKAWPPDGLILGSLLFAIMIIAELKVVVSVLLSVLKGKLQETWQHTSFTNVPILLSTIPVIINQLFMLLRRQLYCQQRKLIALSTFVYNATAASAATSFKFDSDSVEIVLDNSANTHIWNRLEDFVEGTMTYLSDDNNLGVVTIGDSESRPVAVGTVVLTLMDNEGIESNITLEETLYFPSSPVNVLGVTKLGEQLNDPEGTWIKTGWRGSTFSWNFNQHQLDFSHSINKLPVVSVKVGYDTFESFCTLFERAGAMFEPPTLSSCRTMLPTDTSQDLCYLTATNTNQDSVIRHRFALPSSLSGPPFKIGDRAVLTHNGGVHQVVDIMNVNLNEATSTYKYDVALRDGSIMEVTKEFLSPMDEHDFALLPIELQDVQAHINHLDPETVEALLNPALKSEEVLEFIAWHVRAGHLPFSVMANLCDAGQLPKRFKKIALDKKVVCPSCVFGKCKRKPWRTKGPHGTIRRDTETEPGDRTSIDHLISAQPGLVPRLDGRHTRERINSATVFIDHVSGLSYSHLQTSADNVQTVEAKAGYERFAASHNVNIKSYHADNGIFAEQAFTDVVHDSNQTITFCAVGAHHQNGIVERHIQTLTHGTRTNLLHAQRRWPEAIGTILWPFAWKDFEFRYNHFKLDKDGKSPMNKFTKTDVQGDLRKCHPFGCPVFVLEAKLQNHLAILPKWDPRARVGVYLGHSPCHAGSVALVLNPKTLHVSPQYHVVFDDEFSTVPFMKNGEVPPHWSDLVKQSTELATDEDFDLATTWANDFINDQATSVAEEGFGNASDMLLNQPMQDIPQLEPTVPEEATQREVTFSEADIEPEAIPLEEPVNVLPVENTLPTAEEAPTIQPTLNPMLMPTMPDLNDLTSRRSKRTPKPSRAARESSDPRVRRMFSLFTACVAYASCLTSTIATDPSLRPKSIIQRIALHTELVNTHFDGTINQLHHAVLSTVAGDNDTYTLKEMLQQDDKNEFIKAMLKEVVDHENRDHWTVMERSAKPKEMKSILSVWSFKRKRSPDGRILKYKARLCAHGGMQTWGVNYWETYAPVVNWLSIRTLLALSVIHNFETRSIDFVLAFPQADLTVDIYMEMPYGFDYEGRKGLILKLNKNLYGLKDASRTFWTMLKDGLETRGYENQSQSDPCVFLGKDSIVLVYVDDLVVFQRKGSSATDDLIKNLQEGNEAFVFTDDGDLNKYLGVEIKKHANGSIEMTQPHLIERFLEVIGIDEKVNPRPTPAIKPLLHKDIGGLLRKHVWNYRQAIGMANYLQMITRPELSMAVHQAARYCIDPKLMHERSIYRLGKYLQGTKDKGIIFKPDPSRGLECYVDADFAGGWNKADANNAEAVMSRTGYVLMYAGCPLTWCSKLQTEVALSTTEAEYIALSQAIREVIPLIQLLKEINEVFPIDLPTPKVRCKVWEDNNGCITLAKEHKFSPRTKHIAIKYHHFRQHVKDGTLEILPIDTKEQIADIFTKPLDESLFIYLRLLLNGW